jgi:hypothetical protein
MSETTAWSSRKGSRQLANNFIFKLNGECLQMAVFHLTETEVFNNSCGSRFFCRSPGGVLIEVDTRADMQKQEQRQKLF